MRSRRKWTIRLFPISSAFTHSFSPSNSLFLLHICQVHGFQGGIAEHILKFRAKSERCRDSGRAARVTWAPVVSGTRVKSILYICNLLPQLLTRAAVQVKSITSTCAPPSPSSPPHPHSTTAVTVGLEWGWNTTVSPHQHATTCSQSLLCRLSLSRNGGNENCLQSRNSRWCPLLQLQPSQHQQCCYKFYFGGEADCVFET